MKLILKYIFFLFFTFSVMLPAKAQVEFSLVPKIGYSASTYILNFPSIQHRMKGGFAGGLYFQFIKDDIFIFETGLQVTSKGSKQIAFDTIPALDLITTYADFPILIGIQPSKDFFQIKTGLQFSNILGGYARSEGNTRENKDLYNSWDVAAVIQLDYQFEFGLNIGTRFCTGITNMRREEILFPNNVFVDEFRSFNIQILAGYTLPISFK